MLELFKSIVLDFVLFSFIEGILYTKFFEMIGKCKKFKWWEVLLLSIGNCIISQVLPPLIYQIIMILWMTILLILTKKKNFNMVLFLPFLAMLSQLVVEMSVAMFYDLVGIDFAVMNMVERFLYIIPIRFLEIFLLIGGYKMKNCKGWMGDNIKRK